MKRLVVILLATMVFAFGFSQLAFSEIPNLIGYQGRLTDAGGNPIEGSRSITFRIYDASAGGNLLWDETHGNVTVTNGIFDVLLGSVDALNLPFDAQYYLGIQVGADPEMTPRQKLASVGYAYKAKDADTVGGIQVSTTPEPNKIYPLDDTGHIPASALFADYTAGNNLLASADREYVGAGGFMKLKEIILPRGGTLRIDFEMKSNADHGARAQIYRNDSPVGTHYYATTPGQYQSYSQDISGWSAGDKCQLYGGHNGGGTAYIKNFKIYCATPPIVPIVNLDRGN